MGALLATGALAAACTVGAIDFAGKECPCLPDFECDVAANRCVPRGTLAHDAGRDDEAGTVQNGDGAPPGGGRFCASLPVPASFCADFDDPNHRLDGLEVGVFGGGAVSVDDATRTSAPSSLIIDVPSLAAPASAGADVERVLAQPASGLTIECDLRIESLASFPIDVIQLLAPSGLDEPYNWRLRVRPDEAEILETTPRQAGATDYRGGQLGRALPLATWVHVRIAITRTPSESSVETQLDGATVGKASLLFHEVTTPPKLGIGAPYIEAVPPNDTGPVRFRVDNLVVTLF